MTRFSGRTHPAGTVAAALAVAAIALAVVGPQAWAGGESPIHTTYCQTIRYGGYVTLTQRGVMTPGGGGLICYTAYGGSSRAGPRISDVGSWSSR
jgi:hypothetical protein